MNWIDVKDRLPEKGERVMICVSESGSYHVSHLNIYNEWKIAIGIKIVGVTHWQPLPPLPDLQPAPADGDEAQLILINEVIDIATARLDYSERERQIQQHFTITRK